eukprot:scaffold70091_cov66-Cyclotella_meneghiniana.AAC.2
MGISAMVAIALAVMQLPSSPVVGGRHCSMQFVFAKSGCIDKNQIQTMRKKLPDRIFLRTILSGHPVQQTLYRSDHR